MELCLFMLAGVPGSSPTGDTADQLTSCGSLVRKGAKLGCHHDLR